MLEVNAICYLFFIPAIHLIVYNKRQPSACVL